jgi:hypothetical protein
MKKLAFLLLAAAAACSTTPGPQFAWDHSVSFAAVKTYQWYDGPPFQYPGGSSIVDGKFVDQHVRRYVDAEMVKKGYAKIDTGTPDVYVTYTTSPEGVADRDVWGQYSWWSPYVPVGTAYEKEGSLALDIRSPEKKLIWRGFVVRRVGRNPEGVASAIENAVHDLLKNFPPGPASK